MGRDIYTVINGVMGFTYDIKILLDTEITVNYKAIVIRCESKLTGLLKYEDNEWTQCEYVLIHRGDNYWLYKIYVNIFKTRDPFLKLYCKLKDTWIYEDLIFQYTVHLNQ